MANISGEARQKVLQSLVGQDCDGLTKNRQTIKIRRDWALTGMTPSGFTQGEWDETSPLFDPLMKEEIGVVLDASHHVTVSSQLKSGGLGAMLAGLQADQRQNLEILVDDDPSGLFLTIEKLDSESYFLRSLLVYRKETAELAAWIAYKDFGLPDDGFFDDQGVTQAAIGHHMPFVLIGAVSCLAFTQLARHALSWKDRGFLSIGVSSQYKKAIEAYSQIYKPCVQLPEYRPMLA